MVSKNLTTRGAVDIATVLVRTPRRKYSTFLRDSPGVMPVAAKTTSSPRIRSSGASLRPAEALHDRRCQALLRGARALESRHLEPDALRDGGVLDGYRGCGRARIGHANGSFNLPDPPRRGGLTSEVFVESVRTGPTARGREPASQASRLYTRHPGSTSGFRGRHGLARDPEELPVEPLAHGVVVAVEDQLLLLITPARHHVHRSGLDLSQVGLCPPHGVEVRGETPPVGQVPRGGDHLAPVVLLEVSRELLQHGGRSGGDVGHAQAL